MSAKVLEDFWIQKFKLLNRTSIADNILVYEGGTKYGILTGLKIASVMVASGLIIEEDVLNILVTVESTVELIGALNRLHSDKGVVYESRYFLENYSKKPGKKYYDAGVELGFKYVFDMYQAYIDDGMEPDGARNTVKFRIKELYREVLYS